MSANKKDDNFEMTKEELDKFQKAMQNEEFRKLLVEYAQEISDPENKKKYEEEITQMEKERGMDVTFVNPEAGFVVKTTRANDGLKAFVNICYNEHIQKAFSQFVDKEEDGKRKKGEQWSIPFSLSQPRDDLDNANKKCVVFDVVFHPETYQKGQQDKRFKELIINTALDGIEKQLSVKLNTTNLKFPKLKFKGMKQATVIRNKSDKQPEKVEEKTIGGVPFPYPYPERPTTKTEKKKKHNKSKNKPAKNDNAKKCNESNHCLNNDGNTLVENKKQQPNEPVYHIVHRGVIEFQNFTNARDSCTSTRPKELVVSIELPKLKSTGTVELDIFEKQLLLHNENPDYHLDLALPLSVDEANGHAKFDKSKHELVVTLPVLKPETPPHPYANTPDAEQKAEQNLAEKFDSKSSIEIPNSESPSEHPTKTDVNSNEELSAISSEMNTSEDHPPDRHSETSCCEHSNETNFNGLSNELVDKHCATDYIPKDVKSDFPITDNGFVIMDDIISPAGGGEVDPNEYTILNSELESQELCFEMPSNLSELSSPFFQTPSYSYHQDVETVIFVINVPGVVMENVSLGFNENKCYINFPSENTKPGSLPQPDYALYICFADGHNLAADNCDIDVNDENLVLTLTKDDACKGLWDWLMVGPSEEELEKKFFITDENVELLMQEIAEKDPWAGQQEYTPDLKIRSVADDHLTIELQNKLADPVKEPNQQHVVKTQQPSHQDNNGEKANETDMNSVLLENLDLKEGILSNKMQQLKLQNLSSPDEGIEYDMYSSERRENYASTGLSERIAVATDPKLVQEHGHKVSTEENRRKRSDSSDSSSDRTDSSERRKSRSDSTDSISSDTTSNTIPTRKSCIRRTSSTSTDDDDFELSNQLSPSNGSWGSPGKRNVRFNLNPSVRVFSNKKDKQRWKMEQRLKKEKLAQRENSEDKEATIHEENFTTENKEVGQLNRKDSESSVDEEWTLVDKPTDNSLSNNLIFELDE